MVVIWETMCAYIKQKALFIGDIFLSLNGYHIGQRPFYFFCLRYVSDNLIFGYSAENAIMENFLENPTWLSHFFYFPVMIFFCH